MLRSIRFAGSGGPFRSRPVSEFDTITPEEACRHPNWSMGRKISVDSATMMNKGLELIEASFLFGVGSEFIDIVIHPQSIGWIHPPHNGPYYGRQFGFLL